MDICFVLTKSNAYKFHKHYERRLWIDFLNGESNKIPDIVIADIEDFSKSIEKGLTIENFSECHVIDEETRLEKICYNLSNEELEWEIKNIK